MRVARAAARAARDLPVPAALRDLVTLLRKALPRAVRFRHLHRREPLSRRWGFERGKPVDRFYIERFLAAHAADVRGVVLEIGDPGYTRRFGGARVTRSEVLHVDPGAPGATLTGNLETGDGVPADAFDCILLTQTLQFTYDLAAVVGHLHRALREGGVLLLSAPGISAMSGDRWQEYWRFTDMSVRRLLEERFPAAAVAVEAHGNLLAAGAFLAGMSRQELRLTELLERDPAFQLVVTARAVRGG